LTASITTFDGFFGQFLGHLGRAALKQPCGSRNCRIEILGRDHCQIKPLERITHSLKLFETRGQRVNGQRQQEEIRRPQ
jgi:hypothetical protein